MSVGAGALFAFAAVAGVAVVGGQGLLRFINVTVVRILTTVALLGLGGYAMWIAVS
jgi:hypothetical protein